MGHDPLPKTPIDFVHLAATATYRRYAEVLRFSLFARYTNNARFRRYPQTAADPLRVRDRSITRPKAVRPKSNASFPLVFVLRPVLRQLVETQPGPVPPKT